MEYSSGRVTVRVAETLSTEIDRLEMGGRVACGLIAEAGHMIGAARSIRARMANGWRY